MKYRRSIVEMAEMVFLFFWQKRQKKAVRKCAPPFGVLFPAGLEAVADTESDVTPVEIGVGDKIEARTDVQ